MADQPRFGGLQYRTRTAPTDGNEESVAAAEDAPTPPADDPTPDDPPADQETRPRWGTRHRAGLRLSVGILLLIAVAVIGWKLRSPEPPPEPPTLAPLALFQQHLMQIVQGETTQLHTTQFAVDQSMLRLLPIGQLQESESASLDVVLIDQGVVDDEGMAILGQIPDLQHLRLRLSPITDAGLKPLLHQSSLWYLNLPHSELTAEGVRSLQQLPRLRQLRLGSPQLGNDVSAAIAEIRSLRGLHLIGVPITDEGLRLIAGLPHLESLYLDDSAVTDVGWEWLFRNHPELHVHVDQQHHDRDPHAHPHERNDEPR